MDFIKDNIKNIIKSENDILNIYNNLDIKYKNLFNVLKKNIINENNINKYLKDLIDNEILNIILFANIFYNYTTLSNSANNSILFDHVYDLIVDYYNKKYKKEIDFNFNLEEDISSYIQIDHKLKTLKKIYFYEKNKIKKKILELDNELLISSKLDGLSALLMINNNDIKLFTKGDENHGRDISYLINKININKYKIDKNLIIRGELIINKKNKEYFNINKNLRCQVIGLINRKYNNNNDNLLKYIDFIAYDIYNLNKSLKDKYSLLNILKFEIPQYEIIDKNDINDINTDTDIKLLNIYNKFNDNENYEIDGIVISNATNENYNIFAFKIDNIILKTKVLNIIWNNSKNLLYIPKIIIEPIFFNKSKITKINGFSASYLINNKIGIGSEILVKYSGNVIPNYYKTIIESENINLPENYIWDKNKIHILSIMDNIMSISKKIEIFYLIYKIRNFKFTTIMKVITFFKNKNIKIDNIFSFIDNLNEWFSKERKEYILGQKTDDKLLESINIFKKNKISIVSILKTLNNFKSFGDIKLLNIINNYPDILKIIKIENDIKLVSLSELKKINNVDLKIIKIFLQGMIEFIKKRHIYNSYFNINYDILTKKKMNVSFTRIKNKDVKLSKYVDYFTEHEKVIKNLDYLIIEDKNIKNESNKYILANEYNIKIIDIDQFCNILKKNI